MEGISKGARTRNKIIEQVNMLFNEKEKLLTLDEIASEMKLTKSRITNHFPKKELLILGIFRQYEKELLQLPESHKPDGDSAGFKNLIGYYSTYMDLIYKYRFSISFLFVNPLKDEELTRHIRDTYEDNKKRIYARVQSLVQEGQVNEKVLKASAFDVFLFKYTTLMTTWIISLKIYNWDAGYKNIKPVYLKGIISCFEPYLTTKGRKDYEKAIESIEVPA
jgi:AcrR family transcriptional regulator